MTKYIEGNAIDYVLESTDSRILLHVCNSKGKYASGIAGEVRKRIPLAYTAYIQDYRFGEVTYDPDFTVANMVAQERYGYNGKRYIDYDVFERCLLSVRDTFGDSKEYVAPHFIGCGLAGGDWDVVEHKLEKILSGCSLTVVKLK